MASQSISATETDKVVYVLGAGYSGLTAAAELALRGEKVHVIAKDWGFMPTVTIAGTQSRRWPGTLQCNGTFTADDLNDREIASLERFLGLCGVPGTGVRVIPGLKVSRKEGVRWNGRIFDGERLARNRKVNDSMKLLCSPRVVDPSVKEALHAVGFKSVDETPVLCVETKTYFDYLRSVIREHGGIISLGHTLTQEAVDALRGKAVVNCLGVNNKVGGGAEATLTDATGEVVIFKECPKPMPYYVMDDDKSCGILECPDGSLYISGVGIPKLLGGWDQESTRQNVEDAGMVCRAIFGRELDLGQFSESVVGSRPFNADGGFIVGATKLSDGRVFGNLNAVGGAGVTASWANAALMVQELRAAWSAPSERSRL